MSSAVVAPLWAASTAPTWRRSCTRRCGFADCFACLLPMGAVEVGRAGDNAVVVGKQQRVGCVADVILQVRLDDWPYMRWNGNVTHTGRCFRFSGIELALAVGDRPAHMQGGAILADVLAAEFGGFAPSQPTPGGQYDAGAQSGGHLRCEPVHFGRCQDVDFAAPFGLHGRPDAARVGVEHFVLHGGGADRVQQGVGVGVAGRMLGTELGVPLRGSWPA